MKYVEITEKEALDMFRTQHVCYIQNKCIGHLRKVTLVDDDYPESPREWDNLGTIISICGDWDIADKGWSFDRAEAVERVEALQERSNVYIQPIYMYDHSGQTISLSPFGDRWDSGICGYIFVEKKKVFDCFGSQATEENWKELAQGAFEGEIEVYDYYIRGEVYGYCMYKGETVEHHNLDTDERWTTTEWKPLDSCSGFYGYDVADNGMWDCLDMLSDDIFVKPIKEE
jgi:hypothetical protein